VYGCELFVSSMYPCEGLDHKYMITLDPIYVGHLLVFYSSYSVQISIVCQCCVMSVGQTRIYTYLQTHGHEMHIVCQCEVMSVV